VISVENLYKFGFYDPEERPYEYPNVWAMEQTTGPNRLVIAPKRDQVGVLLRLMECMTDPLWVLYVLRINRATGNAGRYESTEPQSRRAVEEFLAEFKTFLECDGRHQLWLGSDSNSDLLVYEQHNRIYAYGRLDEFRSILTDMALEEVPSISLPCPHAHLYHASLDDEETQLLKHWGWHQTPLQPSDDE
jgi:hypothetical protein